jgi:hypothetical protein
MEPEVRVWSDGKEFTDMVGKVKDAFQGLVTALATPFERLLEELKSLSQTPASVDEDRLRHGSAATCPRHGATRGGTCLKCVRGRR